MGTWPGSGPDKGRDRCSGRGCAGVGTGILRVEGDDPCAVPNHDPVALGGFGDRQR